ncbi:putative assembly chaperone of rpl4 [Chionoecetes opilio]|uniref:Putative assembly chaperone of rpl4 n=1 Tax=Chionoecetes opilio TaxID=41210 RepID=A0A8J4YH75_CHIOP|nr:putative assembly chaperone of rpl4 [Chionoecetes opilio]
MGKNKTLARRQRRRAAATGQRGKAAPADPESLSVAELLAAAQEEMDGFQYEAAQALCRTALVKEPDNVAALETSAGLCLEVGNLDGARHCLGRAITVQPESGHEKYMSMAQLMEGREALQCYHKGIEILTRKMSSLPAEEGGDEGAMAVGQDKARSPAMLEGNENLSPAEAEAGGSKASPCPKAPQTPQQKERAGVARQVSTAHCSVAELFMTDLCDEEEAEEVCRRLHHKGHPGGPHQPRGLPAHGEPLCVWPPCWSVLAFYFSLAWTLASFLLVKQEVEEAKQYIGKSLEVWLPHYKAVREGKADPGTFDPVEVCPVAFGTRLSTARILIEVEDHASALEVLEGLLEEDDEVVDLWYLMGWSNYLQGEEQHEAAQYCLHRALQVHAEVPCEDAQLVEHLKELMEELGPYTEGEESENGIEEELDDISEEDEDEEADDTMDTS